MLYWYTGQPGHGKTLHAIQRVLELKAEADKKHAENPAKYPLRPLYVCNVRDFDYDKTGAFPLMPEQWKGWADSPEYIEKRQAIVDARLPADVAKEKMQLLEQEDCATIEINTAFVGAIVLIDEAYEHGIFPKRPPGSKVPRHVQRVAKHRHYGMDIVGVCQSPDTQCDSFLHDLIQNHTHVRRRFGTSYIHLREFDRFERTPEKGSPLVVKRVTLPKKIFGLYKSTELDTTERRIPWYFIALPIAAALALFLMYYTFGSMGKRLGNTPDSAEVKTQAATASRDGASATAREDAHAKKLTPYEYARQFLPRVPSQPWSAPAYDDVVNMPIEAPRIFCMSSLGGQGAHGETLAPSCNCQTEQGTQYVVDITVCRTLARHGQYEPYRDERGDRFTDGPEQIARGHEAIAARNTIQTIPGKMANVGEVGNEVKAPAPSF